MLNIIIADDNQDDLLLLQRMLEKCKLLNPISVASSAAACIEELEIIQQSENGSATALIFLDLNMLPGSGLDVLKHLQTVDYGKHCLVVMLSGLRDLKVMNAGYQLGAKTFLLKPVVARDIVELVNSLAEISIEEAEAGYILHWKQRLTDDSEVRRKAARIRTLAA